MEKYLSESLCSATFSVTASRSAYQLSCGDPDGSQDVKINSSEPDGHMFI